MQDYFPITTVGWCGFVFAAVTLFLLLWSRREQRRERTMAAAAKFESWGITDTAELLKAYTIGNYLGRKSITRVMRRMIERAETEGIPAMFAKASSKIVDHQLTTPEGREAMVEKLRIAEAAAAATKPTPDDPVPAVVTNV